jgi:hypothetical protein
LREHAHDAAAQPRRDHAQVPEFKLRLTQRARTIAGTIARRDGALGASATILRKRALSLFFHGHQAKRMRQGLFLRLKVQVHSDELAAVTGTF